MRSVGPRLALALALVSSGACLVEVRLPADEEELDDCEDPLEVCEGSCVDARVDEDHCGGCGVECELGEQCVDGSCVGQCDDCDPHVEICVDGACECRGGFRLCAGECVDTESDVEHCGACGAACAFDELCDGGECAEECLADECGEQCVELDLDPLNCGACGRSCLSDELCIAGSCRFYYDLALDCEGCPCDCEDEPGFSCCYSDYLTFDVCLEAGTCGG